MIDYWCKYGNWECWRDIVSHWYQLGLGENAVTSSGNLDQLKPLRSSKTSAFFLKWTDSRAREGNSWTHALIMLYFRWYPVVSHFNNPPQLDVLVPSACQCLVIGPGWEPCWGLTSSTLMESTMRDTHPIFIVFHPSLFFYLSLSQMAPPGCWG